MTVPRISAVGFCAHYSPTGDRAFQFALEIAREHEKQLNVFHFLIDPYDPEPARPDRYTRQDLSQLVLERERELRLYYDEMAGDFLEIGFRLCYDDSWRELHRCLAHREFQMLVLAKPEADSWFCRHPIDTFAEHFVCPVVLVDADEASPLRLNSTAALVAEKLHLPAVGWEPIETGDVQKT